MDADNRSDNDGGDEASERWSSAAVERSNGAFVHLFSETDTNAQRIWGANFPTIETVQKDDDEQRWRQSEDGRQTEVLAAGRGGYEIRVKKNPSS